MNVRDGYTFPVTGFGFGSGTELCKRLHKETHALIASRNDRRRFGRSNESSSRVTEMLRRSVATMIFGKTLKRQAGGHPRHCAKKDINSSKPEKIFIGIRGFCNDFPEIKIKVWAIIYKNRYSLCNCIDDACQSPVSTNGIKSQMISLDLHYRHLEIPRAEYWCFFPRSCTRREGEVSRCWIQKHATLP